jgi:SDR family mycofactocin-dependent oxidoreductase
MGLLDNKVALITGGARGQGRAHAVTSAREGADVVIFDWPGKLDTVPYDLATDEDLAETAKLVEAEGRRAITVAGDVRSQQDLDAAVDRALDTFGKLDILVANAGVWYSGNFWELTEQEWADTIDINLGGVWRAAKAAAPAMIGQQSGSMVLISSINGLEGGPTYSHYSASKHGVIGLMRSLAVELAPHGVRCNALCPGPTRTAMIDHQAAWDVFAGHEGASQDVMLDAGRSFMALKGIDWIEPQSQADAALYLNSELAKAVTGTALTVDAGHLVLPGFNHAPSK